MGEGVRAKAFSGGKPMRQYVDRGQQQNKMGVHFISP